MLKYHRGSLLALFMIAINTAFLFSFSFSLSPLFSLSLSLFPFPFSLSLLPLSLSFFLIREFLQDLWALEHAD